MLQPLIDKYNILDPDVEGKLLHLLPVCMLACVRVGGVRVGGVLACRACVRACLTCACVRGCLADAWKAVVKARA